MKLQLLLLVVLGLIANFGMAQDNNALATDSLEQFQAPSFPAGSIIGIQANEISQPKSLKGLRLSLQNNFLDSNNSVTIPDNYALEINPFMLSEKKNFNYESYASSKFKDVFWQNLTFSLAATNKYVVNDTVDTDAFSFGFRTVWLNGQPLKSVVDEYNSTLGKNLDAMALKTIISNIFDEEIGPHDPEDTINVDLNALKAQFNAAATLTDSTQHWATKVVDLYKELGYDEGKVTYLYFKTNYNKIFDSITDRSNRIQATRKLIETVKSERYGWRVEFNGALGLDFPTRNFEYSYVPTGGLWLTAGYTPTVGKGTDKRISKFQFLMMGRYIFNNDKFMEAYAPLDSALNQMDDFLDFGARIAYNYKKFSAGAEFIYRNSMGENFENAYKLNINMNYEIRKNLILTYNFGKNYQSNGREGDLISTLSLNYGAWSMTYDELKDRIKL